MAEKQYSTFFAGKDLFGIDILLVREINRNLAITPVELAPEFITGLLNLRGQIVTVIDLRVKLGLARQETTPQSRVIVLKSTPAMPELLGLLVDSVSDMVTADEKAMEPPPANAGSTTDKYLTGVLKLEKTLVGLLDIGKILSI